MGADQLNLVAPLWTAGLAKFSTNLLDTAVVSVGPYRYTTPGGRGGGVLPTKTVRVSERDTIVRNEYSWYYAIVYIQYIYHDIYCTYHFS